MRFATKQIDRLLDPLLNACGSDFLEALEIPDVEDIALNPDGMLWMKRNRQAWSRIGTLDETDAYAIVANVAGIKGWELHEKCPVLQTLFPLDDSRFEAVIPPITRRPVFSLRVKRANRLRLSDYAADNVLTDSGDPLNQGVTRESFIAQVKGLSHSAILCLAAQKRKTVLYVGPTGSGKTTLADAHLTEIGLLTSDRVVYIEDTPELVCDIPNSVDLLANGDLDMLQCVRVAMRLRPTRIVVGEVRGGEAHALLKAWNTGHPGGIATVHADDAYSGLVRMESLVAESISTPQQRLIAAAIHLVVFIEEEPRVPAGRKVREIIAVTGWDGRYLWERL